MRMNIDTKERIRHRVSSFDFRPSSLVVKVSRNRVVHGGTESRLVCHSRFRLLNEELKVPGNIRHRRTANCRQRGS